MEDGGGWGVLGGGRVGWGAKDVPCSVRDEATETHAHRQVGAHRWSGCVSHFFCRGMETWHGGCRLHVYLEVFAFGARGDRQMLEMLRWKTVRVL